MGYFSIDIFYITRFILLLLQLLKVWDVIEQMCFQTLKIKFPSLKIAGKTIEFGNQSIYPGPKRIPHTWVDRPPVNKNCFSISDIIPATENNDESERYIYVVYITIFKLSYC